MKRTHWLEHKAKTVGKAHHGTQLDSTTVSHTHTHTHTPTTTATRHDATVACRSVPRQRQRIPRLCCAGLTPTKQRARRRQQLHHAIGKLPWLMGSLRPEATATRAAQVSSKRPERQTDTHTHTHTHTLTKANGSFHHFMFWSGRRYAALATILIDILCSGRVGGTRR